MLLLGRSSCLDCCSIVAKTTRDYEIAYWQFEVCAMGHHWCLVFSVNVYLTALIFFLKSLRMLFLLFLRSAIFFFEFWNEIPNKIDTGARMRCEAPTVAQRSGDVTFPRF